MNKQRKAKLSDRARRYAHQWEAYDDRWTRAYQGFNDGYRAAMKDARKAIGHATLKAPLSIQRQLIIAGRITRFLRPLR